MGKLGINNENRSQTWLLVLVWVLIFSMPLLSGEFDDGINWSHIFRIWKETIIVFGVFFINRFVLLPKLFFKEKRTAYLITVIIVILAMSSIVSVFYKQPYQAQDFLEPHNREFTPSHGMMPPDIERPLNDKMPPPDSIKRSMKTRPNEKFPEPPPGMSNLDKPLQQPSQKGPIPPYSNVFIMSLLIVGFDTGLVFFSRWTKAEKNKLKTEKENVQTQMAFLKNQVSPHFFMNTLNNIHALVDINSEEAKESIIRLSELMDYMLYESEASYVSLRKEFEFIESYVELMRLRFTDVVEIVLDIPNEIPPVKVPPLLTISFIENAFKYGVDTEKKSYVHIHFNVSEHNLLFRVENALVNKVKGHREQGIGIENARKRLELIYNNQYSLFISDKDNKFEVNLNIPV